MRKFRVAEIFGPTIQGEGRHVGVPCYFIRFGGCDYRCHWCDSPHAVLPELVSRLTHKTELEIIKEIRELPGNPEWIVYSGGNPALFDLTLLTSYLSGDGYSIMLETQGSIWKDWIGYLDEVCVSPKPPSSRNATPEEELTPFLSNFVDDQLNRVYLKVVVFNDIDYEYARWVHATYPYLDMFVSAGNEDPYLPTVGNPSGREKSGAVELTREVVLDKMRWLMEKVARDEYMRDVRVLPQLHVLAWGNARGR